MSWRRFCRHLEEVLKTYWQDVLKMSYWSWSRRPEDVFWSRMTKVNIFVLIKTSSENEDERRLQDVFITSSRRLHNVFIKTNVCWEDCEHMYQNQKVQFYSMYQNQKVQFYSREKRFIEDHIVQIVERVVSCFEKCVMKCYTEDDVLSSFLAVLRYANR